MKPADPICDEATWFRDRARADCRAARIRSLHMPGPEDDEAVANSPAGSGKLHFRRGKLPGQSQNPICNQSVEPDLAEPAYSGNRVHLGVPERGWQRIGSGTQPYAPALLKWRANCRMSC